MSKNHITAEEFLSDDVFLSWYFKEGSRDVKQWKQWEGLGLASRQQFEEAIQLLDSLRLQEEEPSEEQASAAENSLLFRIEQLRKKTSPPIVQLGGRSWWIAAASLILLVCLYGGYRWLSSAPELKTAYGEIKEQQLPDGTEVTVNANSKLICSTGWQDGKDREVWLRGEAFFHVRKTPMKSRFIVHTDHFDIIVTGTQFNAVNRQGKANVMLKEGSVILHTEEGKELKMAPGDFVEYNSHLLEKVPVKTDSVLAWKEHKLIFDNTPVRELVKIIYDHYGIKVKLADESIGNKTISGILPNNNLDILLQALEATMDFEVTRVGDTIIIKDHL
jgi:ferric-dicitrate binding protein FerR (iron transport regulator)